MLRKILLASTLALGGTALAVCAGLSAQEMPTPTEQHRHLQQAVGSWEGTLTLLMPGTPEMSMPATEKVEAIGEFWTVARFECDMGGMPFVGTGATGYDTNKKMFIGTWIDNTTTQLVVMEGELDPKSKALVMRYQAPDPMSGELTAHRIETVSSADSYTSTFYIGAGEGVKSMQIQMKRKAAKAGAR